MIIQYRNVSDFHSLRFRGPGRLEILQGEQEGVRIEAAGQYLDQIESDVESGNLTLGLRCRDRDVIDLSAYQTVITYRLTVKDLKTLNVSHHGRVTLPDLDCDEFHVVVSGHGSVDLLNLTADRISIKASDHSQLKISGDVEQQSALLSEQASLTALSLVSDNADFRLTGNAVAEVRVNDELNTYVGEFAKLTYVGYPNVEKFGAGTMVRRRKPKLTTRGTEHG